MLVRSPYGRRGIWGLLYGRWFAHAGFNVVVASCRGCDTPVDSFDAPMVHEAADGAATVGWLRQQPWFDGRLATAGLSYLGYNQWALAVDPPPELQAMVVQVAPHEFARVNWPGGAFALSDTVSWAQTVSGPQRQDPIAAIRGARRRRKLLTSAFSPRQSPALLDVAPIATAGIRVGFWEDWVSHGAKDAYWAAYDQSAALERVEVPVLIQGGWHDLFRRASVEQFVALRRRGVDARLTMGPWTHTGFAQAWPQVASEATRWLDSVFASRLERTRHLDPAPVRVTVLGTSRSDDHADWPPPGWRPQRWTLADDGRLEGPERTSDVVGTLAEKGLVTPDSELDPVNPSRGSSRSSQLTYDPTDPTPSLGGPLLGPGAGPVDNRELERRIDVLTWTSPPLRKPLNIAGPVEAGIFVAASGPHDLFARVCDVAPDGSSTNICDGIVAAPSGGNDPRPGPNRLTVGLGPIAAEFGLGHRLRLQVSAGAHPRFARNPGTGESIAAATKVVEVRIDVFHGADFPSFLSLPVIGPEDHEAP